MSITDSSAAVTATSLGVVVTSNATANTKGSYTELIASTSEETYWVQIVLKCPLAVQDRGFLIDLATGAAASEVVKVANIPFFANANGLISQPFPLTIPSSTRVAARCQDSGGGNAVEMMIYLSNDSGYGTSTVNETIGAQTGTSQGTDVDPGGTDNTKGSYTQLVASTADEYHYWLVFMGNSTNTAQTNQSYLVDALATGVSTSEVDKIANVPFSSTALELPSTDYSFFETVASSTRIAARGQSNNAVAAGANDRLFDITLIGFKLVAPSGGGGGMIVHPGMTGGMRG